jgi:hypothetical protein
MEALIKNIEQLIDEARAKVVAQYESTYGANVDYAKLLNQKWADFDWFELKHDDKSDLGKAVRAEGDKFRKGIKAWHTNPSTAWGQIRSHAKTAKYGKVVVEGAEGNAEGTAEGNAEGAKRNRSPMLRNIEELTDLFIFNRKNENADDKLKQCQVNIGKALEALGVNLSMIK